MYGHVNSSNALKSELGRLTDPGVEGSTYPGVSWKLMILLVVATTLLRSVASLKYGSSEEEHISWLFSSSSYLSFVWRNESPRASKSNRFHS